jgi:hypothetical protein
MLVNRKHLVYHYMVCHWPSHNCNNNNPQAAVWNSQLGLPAVAPYDGHGSHVHEVCEALFDLVLQAPLALHVQQLGPWSPTVVTSWRVRTAAMARQDPILL